MVETPPANAGDADSIPGLGRSTGEGKGKATHSRSLAWKTPGTEESSELQSIGPGQTRISDLTTIATYRPKPQLHVVCRELGLELVRSKGAR